MNSVSIIGRLTKDPELRTTQSGTSVCSFTVAVDRKFKSDGQPDADFINVVAWKKKAEFVAKYFAKGQRIALTGSIQTRSWDDDDGKKHYVTEVVAESVYFCDSKKPSDSGKHATTEAGYNDDAAPYYPLDDDSDIPF